MKRDLMLQNLSTCKDKWDIVIIGGGATGMGIAVDSASRGFKTLLLEQYDFGKGTSSRSTKLVHGGVRYLAQGNISLVYEGLRERGLMLKNAPHLVRNQKFIIPAYTWRDVLLYTTGLNFYDLLSGKLSFGRSRFLSREKTIIALPSVNKKGLKGGILYHDGQFDDTRMLVSLAATCADHGGTVINYMKVNGFIKDNNKITGLTATDTEKDGVSNAASSPDYTIRARTIINAAGVFADEIIQLDVPGSRPQIRPSQGIHIMLDRDFLKSDHALMVPKTIDGRVMFAVPWYNRVVAGTTDTLLDEILIEPKPLEQEIDFILDTCGQYLERRPSMEDILCVFAGLRPLAAPQEEGKRTMDISRKHKITSSPSGLITIVGGKWTSYRKMAEDAVNEAIKIGNLEWKACLTSNMRIHGFDDTIQAGTNSCSPYGSELPNLDRIENESEDFRGFLSEKLGIRKSQVIWAVREEMARTLEDALARRTRALFLDVRESIHIAPEAARLMARELGRGDDWLKDQLRKYTELAEGYVPGKNEQ
jgi:glycerol-3-phosphate dehydrogenase